MQRARKVIVPPPLQFNASGAMRRSAAVSENDCPEIAYRFSNDSTLLLQPMSRACLEHTGEFVRSPDGPAGTGGHLMFSSSTHQMRVAAFNCEWPMKWWASSSGERINGTTSAKPDDIARLGFWSSVRVSNRTASALVRLRKQLGASSYSMDRNARTVREHKRRHLQGRERFGLEQAGMPREQPVHPPFVD